MDVATPDDSVVVDVVFDGGVLYLELANLADRPALKVARTEATTLKAGGIKADRR